MTFVPTLLNAAARLNPQPSTLNPQPSTLDPQKEDGAGALKCAVEATSATSE